MSHHHRSQVPNMGRQAARHRHHAVPDEDGWEDVPDTDSQPTTHHHPDGPCMGVGSQASHHHHNIPDMDHSVHDTGDDGMRSSRRSTQSGPREGPGAGPRDMEDPVDGMGVSPYGGRAGGGMSSRPSHGGRRAESSQETLVDDMHLNPPGPAAGRRNMEEPADDMGPNPHGGRAGGGISSRASHGGRRATSRLAAPMDDMHLNPPGPGARRRNMEDPADDMGPNPHGGRAGGGMSSRAPHGGRRATSRLAAPMDDMDLNPRGSHSGRRDMPHNGGNDRGGRAGSRSHGDRHDAAKLLRDHDELLEEMLLSGDSCGDEYERNSGRLMTMEHQLDRMQLGYTPYGMEWTRNNTMAHGYDDEESDYQPRGSRHGRRMPPAGHGRGSDRY